MKIKQQLFLGFGGVIFLTAVIGVFALVQLHRIVRPLQEDIPEAIKSTTHISHLDSLAQFIRYYDEVLTQSVRNFAFTQNPKWQERYQATEPKLDAVIKEATDQGDEQDRELFSSVDQANLALVEIEYRAIKLVNDGRAREAVAILDGGEYEEQKAIYQQALRKYVERTGHQYDEALSISTKEFDAVYSYTHNLLNVSILLIFGVLLFALLVSTGIGLAIYRSISTSLQRLKIATIEIGKGKFDIPIEIASNNEISHLALSFKQMAKELEDTTIRIDDLNQEITLRKQAEETLASHARQQAEVAEFSQFALAGNSLDDLFDQAVSLISRTLGTKYAEILEHRPEQGVFFLRAGVGWKDGWVGHKSVPDGSGSQGGYTLLQKKPVIAEDIHNETRFSPPSLLTEHNAVSGMTVAIPGADRPFGVLGVHTDRMQRFSEDGAHFLEAVANVLAAAIHRRVGEESLKEAEQRWRAFTDNTDDIIQVLDINGNIQYMSKVYPPHTLKDVVGKPVFDFMDPNSAEKARNSIDALIDTQKPQQLDIVINVGDQKVNFSIKYVPEVYDGKVIRIIVLVSDITARKQAEEKLQEREAVFSAISESAQDAIVMIDSDGKVTHWNSAAERIFGYAREEVVDRILHDFFTPQNLHSAHYEAFPKFAASGQGAAIGQTLELPGLHKDGREIPVELSLSATHVQGQWHAIGIMRDITDRKQAEKELFETNHQLEEATARANSMAGKAEMANIAKSEFLANMSHEIRTPMNGVIGMTSLLLDTELSAEQREFMETIRNSGDSLLGIINDLLDYSKIEAGKFDLQIIDFDLRVTLDEMNDLVALKAHEKGLEFISIVHHEVPSLLCGDPGRLRQILINLVGNATKFTEKGEVAILASLDDEDATHATVRFSVTDTGIGIPQDRMDRLFKSFFQVDSSTTRKYGGTGLGLTISKQLAELMGGQVGVESEGGKGSTFWFTAVLGKQSEGKEKRTVVPDDIRGKRILIVDDNATNRFVLREQLKSWECRYEEASSGEQALEELSHALSDKDPFEIAIIDMQMPEMDGETLGQKIKQDPDLKSTTLIMMTSLGQRGDVKRLQEIGFAAYLTKPVKQSKLYDCLATVFGLQKEAQKDRPAEILTRHSLTEDQKHKVRILVAEDNVVNQKVALLILGKLGYSADAVTNGQEAVKALGMIPYDIVLMDCQMPEMDGYKATGEIRNPNSEVLDHKVPVVALTANAMQSDREKCLKAGMDDFLSKPVKPQALSDMLEKWLPKKKDEGGQMNDESIKKKEEMKGDKGEIVLSQIFDRAALLNRLMDDEELVETIIAGFLDDMPRQITALRAFVEEGHADQAGAQAHKIKGAAANVTGQALQEIAHAMEKAGKSGDMEALDSLMPELESRFERLKKAMEGNK